MSRRISNPKLARLCQAHALSITQLAAALKCTREVIYRYASGRKAMPLLEEKLAAIFKLKVPEFRKIIFNKGGKHVRASAADPQVARRRARVIWHYDAATRRETWFNHGERISEDPAFMQLRADCMRYPHGAIIKARNLGQATIIIPLELGRNTKRRAGR